MPESFFSLTQEDRRDLILLGASELSMQPLLLEKDVWVCWALQRLFSMPGDLKIVFKGGTSLSKVYAAIDRFSEDIDVTIDYRDLEGPVTGRIPQ
ncbi:MAG: nucleotidyl transferase AbiEii/AbiGii toxin family protein [Candidatus Competibacteraceae bacterium]|nr:nucleotidyl transferase AbiEii/AbiGii toxin family protein [Candidatus Competibacteraceae bacterium]